MLDLASGTQTQLSRNRGQITLGAPAIAADGRVVFARKIGDDFDLWLRMPDGSERALTTDGKFNYSPRWWGPDAVLALHEVEGRTQAVRIDVATGRLTVVSDAPFVVLDPVPLPGNRVAFVNREGWGWTLDTLPVAVASAAPGTGRIARRRRPPDGHDGGGGDSRPSRTCRCFGTARTTRWTSSSFPRCADRSSPSAAGSDTGDLRPRCTRASRSRGATGWACTSTRSTSATRPATPAPPSRWPTATISSPRSSSPPSFLAPPSPRCAT